MAETKVTVEEGSFLRIPVRTHIITEEDDIVNVVATYAQKLLLPGDIIAVSESAVAASQGRCVPIEKVKPGLLARFLWRFVRKVPYGVGLRSPYSMQCAIEEVGRFRILFAALVGALGKLLRRRGDFYRVAGIQAALIDAPYTSGIKRYYNCVIMGPKDPEGVAKKIKKSTGAEAAIVDANDIGGSWVIGSTEGINCKLVEKILRDNPAGQRDEQTPIIIIREIKYM